MKFALPPSSSRAAQLWRCGLVERLQHVIDSVHLKGLNRVVFESRCENDWRHAQLALHELLYDAEAVKSGHLHVQKDEIRIVLLDERERFKPVFALRDHVDFRKAAQEKLQLVARGPLVVDNHCADSHGIFPLSIG